MSFRTENFRITPITFGTGKVDDKSNPEHIAVVRAAMEAGVWFHTSHAYGEGRVFELLRETFAQDRAHTPPIICKVDGQSPALLRETVEICLRGTGKEQLEIAQICGNPPAASLRPGGEMHEVMCELQQRGLVGSYSLEFFWPFSANLQEVVAEDLFDSVIFYLNTTEREVSNPVWDTLQARQTSILALRTFGGRPDYFGQLNDQALQALRAIFERSGCTDQAEFRFRFVRSLPNVKTTIAATSKTQHFQQLLQAEAHFKPLPVDLVNEIIALYRIWFAEKGI